VNAGQVSDDNLTWSRPRIINNKGHATELKLYGTGTRMWSTLMQFLVAWLLKST